MYLAWLLMAARLMEPTKSIPHFSKGCVARFMDRGILSQFCGFATLWQGSHLFTNSTTSLNKVGHQRLAWSIYRAMVSATKCPPTIAECASSKIRINSSSLTHLHIIPSFPCLYNCPSNKLIRGCILSQPSCSRHVKRSISGKSIYQVMTNFLRPL